MRLASLLNIEFPFLNSWKSRLLYMIVTLALCAFFLLGLKVFNLSSWMRFPKWISFLGVSGFLLGGLAVMVLSQLFLLRMVKEGGFKRYHLLGWLVFELVVITFVLTSIYRDEAYTFVNEFLTVFRYTIFILALPYSFSLLLMLVLFPKKEQIQKDSSKMSVDLFHFTDEREQIKLSVKRSNVLYIESTDNYVTIYYCEEQKLKHELIRNSLKRIESIFLDKGLVRCHRSFVVNIENVESMKKEGRAYKLKLKYVDQLIPVSRGFAPSFTSLLIS